MLHERDPGVTEGIQAGRDGHARGLLEGEHAVRVDPELRHRVEGAGPAGQLDHVGGVVDRHETPAPVRLLDDPRDVLIEHVVSDCGRDLADALGTVEQAAEVACVEDVLHAGQADGGARHDHGPSRCSRCILTGHPRIAQLRHDRCRMRPL